jgi:hypothetical protein
MRDYSNSEVLVANGPYAAMILLGAATIASSFQLSPGAWLGAIGYVLAGLAGAVWIMVFVCPHCAFYDTRRCPCGYGKMAARLVPKGQGHCFAQKFKRHIPVIVPLWLVPVLCGAVSLTQAWSGAVAGLVTAFAVDAFVVVPLISRKHGCTDCPQREGCPWMNLGAGKRQSPPAERGES